MSARRVEPSHRTTDHRTTDHPMPSPLMPTPSMLDRMTR
jgi:hypothetical protein